MQAQELKSAVELFNEIEALNNASRATHAAQQKQAKATKVAAEAKEKAAKVEKKLTKNLKKLEKKAVKLSKKAEGAVAAGAPQISAVSLNITAQDCIATVTELATQSMDNFEKAYYSVVLTELKKKDPSDVSPFASVEAFKKDLAENLAESKSAFGDALQASAEETKGTALLNEVASLAGALIDVMPETVARTETPAPAGTAADAPEGTIVKVELQDALAAGELVVEQVPEVEGCRIEKKLVNGELDVTVVIDHVLTNGSPVTPMEEAFANAKPLRRQ